MLHSILTTYQPLVPQDIQPFSQPKVELEQYPTGPHLASRLLFTVPHVVEGSTMFDHMFDHDAFSQYTPGFAHTVLHTCCLSQVANSFDEFQGQTVLDLGCGTVWCAYRACTYRAFAALKWCFIHTNRACWALVL